LNCLHADGCHLFVLWAICTVAVRCVVYAMGRALELAHLCGFSLQSVAVEKRKFAVAAITENRTKPDT
jgi:hypothetical protein